MLSTVIFVGLSSLFFITDLSLHGLFGAPRCFLVTTFFYTLVDVRTPFWRLALLVMGILYESFLVRGIIGEDLILIIPLALALSYVRRRVHLFPWIDALLALVCVGITSLRIFNPLSLSWAALGQLILFHFISALTMVYYRER